MTICQVSLSPVNQSWLDSTVRCWDLWRELASNWEQRCPKYGKELIACFKKMAMLSFGWAMCQRSTIPLLVNTDRQPTDKIYTTGNYHSRRWKIDNQMSPTDSMLCSWTWMWLPYFTNRALAVPCRTNHHPVKIRVFNWRLTRKVAATYSACRLIDLCGFASLQVLIELLELASEKVLRKSDIHP